MTSWREYLGEFIGTAILVFIGCGSVAVSVVYYPLELWHIALIWAFGVALAIYATHSFSHSHLNPAVTLAMVLANKCERHKIPAYFGAQLAGAFGASLLLLSLINSDLATFEATSSLIRGESNSYRSAVMFGEFFPETVSHSTAYIAEGLGTFVLVLTIFLLDANNKKFSYLNPVFIGLTVGAIILVVAPYTQAGLNPARDFGPRLVAYFGGWGSAAFPYVSGSFFTVYILSPLIAGSLAYLLFSLFDKQTK